VALRASKSVLPANLTFNGDADLRQGQLYSGIQFKLKRVAVSISVSNPPSTEGAHRTG
jgi:hypothetical protein